MVLLDFVKIYKKNIIEYPLASRLHDPSQKKIKYKININTLCANATSDYNVQG